MVNETTNNKNYPLPHPSNIASQDVTRIATAITMIDADISECSDSISTLDNAVQNLNSKSLKIPSDFVGQVDTELNDLQPGQYIVVNEDASGFSTVEGGGGEGGKKGEILIKKSDKNFDTTWVDPRAILKKAPTVKETTEDLQLPNNGTIILGDVHSTDSIDDLPRHGLTQRQINSDTLADSSYTYILCNEIDDTTEDDSDIATTEKFGRVKIGSGISVDNGTISVPIIGVASEDDFGMVKIGDGLAVQDGVVSAQTYPHADHENFGIIKPSADFNFDSNGALKLASKNEDIIYQKGAKNVVESSTIRIIPTCAYYRAFVNTDTLFSFDMNNFIPKADISFDLEIVADAPYVISFGSSVAWDLPCAGVNAGSTIIHFDKLMGDTQFRGTLKSADTSSVRLLTINTNADINENYICGHNGLAGTGYNCLQVRGAGNRLGITNPTEFIWYIDFMRSTYVDYFEYGNNDSPSTVEYFYIEGSVDRKNWKKLLTRENVQLSTCKLDSHGYFKHYRIRSRNLNFTYFRWFGFDVDDDLYELQKLVPVMNSNFQSGFVLTSSGLRSGNLYNLTTEDVNTYAYLETRLNGEFWIKYELPEAQSVDLIDLGANNNTDEARIYTPTWFKVEGSNDDENWTTILERAYLTRWERCETRQYWITSSTPYKFYRLLSIEQPSSTFMLSRFRLYKKIDGRLVNNGFIPPLTSASQAGYEISASSTSGSGHYPYQAFDGSTSTRWASASGDGVGAWIQIKFPVETLCTTAWLTSRNDEYYGQAATDFTILGSADGINFETLKTVTGQTWSQGEQKVFNFTNTVPYLYYRVQAQAIQNGTNYFAFSEVNFGTQMREYRRHLERNEYLVPVMSANSQNGYVASAISQIYDYAPWKAFDRTATAESDCWLSSTDQASDSEGYTNGWIQIKLPEAKVANNVNFVCRNGPNLDTSKTSARNWTLKGSNDGANWTTLLTVTDQIPESIAQSFSYSFENTTAYLYYKVDVTRVGYGGAKIAIGQLNLIYKELITEY